MTIIDLTAPLNENTPVWPGDPKPEIIDAGLLAEDGFEDHKLTIGTHVGTHIDAPSHMVEGGKTLDKFPAETFVGDGVLVDARGKDVIEPSVLKDVELNSRTIVLFWTGRSDGYGDADYFENYPVLSLALAKVLVEKGVKMVGTDASSPDAEPFEVHKELLGSDVLIIENLVGLKQLDGKQFKVTALPLNLNIDGSPARVIAELI